MDHCFSSVDSASMSLHLLDDTKEAFIVLSVYISYQIKLIIHVMKTYRGLPTHTAGYMVQYSQI